MSRTASWRVGGAALVVTLVFVWPDHARAQYKGLRIPGSAGLQAGTQAPPGIYVGNLFWVYPTDTLKDDNGDEIGSGNTSLTPMLEAILVSWVTNYKIFGGNVGGTVGLPWMKNLIERDLLDIDSGWGYSDSILTPLQIGWHKPRYDMLAGYTLYLPNIGVIAYRQFKVTEDSGADVATIVEGLKDRVYGIGPEFNIFIPQAKLSVIARLVPEFGARARTQGTTFSVTVVYAAKSLAHHAP
jgi:hypothetical protein